MAMALPLLLLMSALAAPALAQSSLMSQMASSQFTGFLRLMEEADIVYEVEEALHSGSGATFFCPTDDALMQSTSPALLAFLKLPENKATLRKVLLAHIVPQRLSPFQWEGAHKTLSGSPLKLSMDTTAFYADKVPVSQYNSLVSGDASIHAISSLILPLELSPSAKTFVEEATEVRRVLIYADAPEPSSEGAPSFPKSPPAIPQGESPTTPNAASSQAAVSVLALAVAAAAALLV